MKQINNNEKSLKVLHPIMVCSFFSGLENYTFPNLKINWIEKSNYNYALLKEKGSYYMFQNHNSMAYLFLLVKNEFEVISNRKKIEDLINKLNIKDEVSWINEWIYLKEDVKELNKNIVDWINADLNMEEIKINLKKITQLSENQINDLVKSCYLLNGRY